MNIIMAGCEFAGKTTLADLIVKWCAHNLGSSSHFHDHFTIPSSELTGQASGEYKAAHPQIKEMLQRFMISYHVSESFYSNADHNLMGAHIEEAVYAPLYYGYGGKDSGAPSRSPEGQRTELARHYEEEILERAPEVVLVLVEASPEVIRERMRANVFPDAETTAAQQRSKPSESHSGRGPRGGRRAGTGQVPGGVRRFADQEQDGAGHDLRNTSGDAGGVRGEDGAVLHWRRPRTNALSGHLLEYYTEAAKDAAES